MPPEIDNEELFQERKMPVYCGPHPKVVTDQRMAAWLYLHDLPWKQFLRMREEIRDNLDIYLPTWLQVWYEEYDRRTLLRPLEAAEPSRDGNELLRGA